MLCHIDRRSNLKYYWKDLIHVHYYKKIIISSENNGNYCQIAAVHVVFEHV